jgi:transposase-like protein
MELDTKVSSHKDIIPKDIIPKISLKSKRISEYIVDETLLKVGSEYVWLWVAIEPENRNILTLSISKERNMLIAERFISDPSVRNKPITQV